MKKIDIWLNEGQYLQFKEKARRLDLTPYALLKKLALDYLDKT